MKNRRQFLKMSAGSAALGVFGAQSALAATAPFTRRVWIMSDLHCGYAEGAKDGAEWFESACKDMSEAGFQTDYAMVLGDITHGGSEAQLQRYIEHRAKSGIATWHEIAGNHEYHDGKVEAYTRLLRSTKPYSVIDGNIAWFFLSDEEPGVPGKLSEESCQWFETELAAHVDKTTIVCSHQLVKGTIFKSDDSQRQIHPVDRIAGIIAKSKIDLWLCGHEHHTPYSKAHIARVKDTTYINVASMSHAYKTGSSESCLLEFKTGSKEIVARRRVHDSKQFRPEFEVTIPLRHEIKLAAM